VAVHPSHKEDRPGVASFSAAIIPAISLKSASPDNAVHSLPLHVDGARSALDRDRMAPGAQAAYVIVVVVPTRTLDSVLQEAAPIPIDHLSINVWTMRPMC
jgi:hypothetical protein